jgi:hypothetical protein
VCDLVWISAEHVPEQPIVLAPDRAPITATGGVDPVCHVGSPLTLAVARPADELDHRGIGGPICVRGIRELLEHRVPSAHVTTVME